MLESYALTRFKAFNTKQRFRMAPITLVYGPNSGGKSSIIQSMLLLKQSWMIGHPYGHFLHPQGPLVDLGSANSFFFKQRTAQPVCFEFQFDRTPLISRVVEGKSSIAIEFAKLKGVSGVWLPQMSKIVIEVIGIKVAFSPSKPARRKSGTGLPDEDEDPIQIQRLRWRVGSESDLKQLSELVSMYWASLNSLMRSRTANDAPSIEEVMSTLVDVEFVSGENFFNGFSLRTFSTERGDPRFTFILRATDRLIQGCFSKLSRLLRGLSYIGPLRMPPHRAYSISGPRRRVGSQGEDTMSLLYDNPARVRELNEWMTRFEIPYTVSVEPIKNSITGPLVVVSLKDHRNGVRVAPKDVGFGISQLLPILVEGLTAAGNSSSEEAALVCVEQPELHLHPRLQAHIGDFLIDTAIKRRDCQWMIETHSEALVLRILRRLREQHASGGEDWSSLISLIYVQPGSTGSSVSEIPITPQGEFGRRWPEGFFAERLEDL